MMDTNALFRRREAEFLKEIRPYLHYALQSLVLAVVIGFLLFSIGYKQFLQWVTPEFPWRLAASAFMLAALGRGRIRTYLQEADTIFLLPQEKGMGAYLQSAMQRAGILQALLAGAAWMLVWPMYHKLNPTSGWVFFLLLILWIVFKQVMLLGYWTELQLQESSTRRWFTLLRWSLCALLTYAVFALPLGYGIVLLAAGSMAYLLCSRIPRRHKVHWNLLFDVELRHKAGIYRVLNWFVDVPALQGKARNVHWFNRFIRLISFRRESAYRYLYSLIWLRSELFGITCRLTFIGLIVISVSSNNYAVTAIYTGFACISAIQLADLKRFYREHLWQHIYPLSPQLRVRSLNRVRFYLHLGVLVLLAIPAFFTLDSPLWAVGMLAIAAVGSMVYHRFK